MIDQIKTVIPGTNIVKLNNLNFELFHWWSLLTEGLIVG